MNKLRRARWAASDSRPHVSRGRELGRGLMNMLEVVLRLSRVGASLHKSASAGV
jgi:hypothetical protein